MKISQHAFVLGCDDKRTITDSGVITSTPDLRRRTRFFQRSKNFCPQRVITSRAPQKKEVAFHATARTWLFCFLQAGRRSTHSPEGAHKPFPFKRPSGAPFQMSTFSDFTLHHRRQKGRQRRRNRTRYESFLKPRKINDRVLALYGPEPDPTRDRAKTSDNNSISVLRPPAPTQQSAANSFLFLTAPLWKTNTDTDTF